MFLQVSRSLPLEADTSLIHTNWALNLCTAQYLSYVITRPVNNLFLIPPAEICYRLPHTQQILIYFTDHCSLPTRPLPLHQTWACVMKALYYH